MLAYDGDAEDYTPTWHSCTPRWTREARSSCACTPSALRVTCLAASGATAASSSIGRSKWRRRARGVVIYLRQEGRGIGIINKLKAYQLQDAGLDTIEANLHLGLEVDARHYGVAQGILQDLGIGKIQLLTNNPLKVDSFDEGPIEVVRRLPIMSTQIRIT